MWVALALISIGWAVATPLGGSPDEPAHIIKAASVVRGQFLGDRTDKAAATSVEVPAGIASAHSWPCYAFDPAIEASCLQGVPDGSASATATTTAGLYNPTYYALVGWPSLLTDDTSRSVLAMRVVSALLVSLLLAIAFEAMVRFRPPLVAGFAFLAAATPMCFFLAGAVNPNALEVAAGAALTASLLLVVRRSDQIRIRLWLAAIVGSGLLLAQARGISPLWMALIAVAVLLSSPPQTLRALLRRWDVVVTVAILALGVLAATLWSLSTGTLASMGVFPGAGKVTPFTAFVTMLFDRSVDAGLVGVFGWLDTPAPALAYAWWAFLGVGIWVVAAVTGRGRSLAGFLVGLAGFFLIPPIAQALSVQSAGYIWQGRYSLVGYVVAVILAGAAVRQRTLEGLGLAISPRRTILVVGAVTVFAHFFTYIATVKRYAVGLDGTWSEFARAPQWAPPLGLWPWALLVLGGLAIMLVCWYRLSQAPPIVESARSVRML